MNKLRVSDNMKIGKQELLLDPTKTANKCGSEVDAVLLNDLFYRRANGSYITASEFILQENISIENLNVTLDGLIAKITWVGTNDVLIYTDDATQGVAPLGDREHTMAFTVGQHKIMVQATRDRRGLSKTFTVSEIPAVGLTIEYGGNE